MIVSMNDMRGVKNELVVGSAEVYMVVIILLIVRGGEIAVIVKKCYYMIRIGPM